MADSRWMLVLVTAALALAACGQKNDSKTATTPGSAPVSSAPASANATADQVADEARGNVRCPATIASSPRAANAPVDDVLNVRAGQTYEEAANIVMCTNKLMVVTADTSRGFNIPTYGVALRQGFHARLAEPRIAKTSREYMAEMSDAALARGSNRVIEDMKPGQSKWFVATMGMPGQEHVLSVAREEWFEEGRNPTIASVEEALAAKYGPPTHKRVVQNSASPRSISWAYDPLQRRITETSPLFNRCHGVANPNAGVNLTPNCGLVIEVEIQPLRDNPQIAKFLRVGVVDEAGGYALLKATEQALQQGEAERRRKQVESAAKGAKGPSL